MDEVQLQMILFTVTLLTGNVICGWHHYHHQHSFPVTPQQSPFPPHDSSFGRNRPQRSIPDEALVDYPFTVEFIPKNQPVTSRSGVPLVDYPFRIEYVMRRNPAYRGNRRPRSSISSLISNLGSSSFQSTDQYHLLRGGWYRD